MAQWITQALIEDRWGETNIEEWSTTESGGGSAAATRITNAIAIAEEEVEDRFRGGRFVVPLSLSGGALDRVKWWSSTIAGVILYETRGRANMEEEKLAEMNAARDLVHRQIDRVLLGIDGFDADLAQDTGPTGPEAV